MMTCKELIGFIEDYRTRELPAPQREAFDAHLQVCPPCVAYLATYEQTITLARGAESAAAAGAPEDLVKAILDARRRG